ncbi:MAG: proprotein convertase P-domain-containing protein [Phycisphaerae bacterium]|nr:proprotein convertase P-domain-containing protein [Phycisphaerae bacterium]
MTRFALGLIASALAAAYVISVHATPTAAACPCPGDINGSGAVNLQDIPGFAAALISAGGGCDPSGCADLNGDGACDGKDVHPFVDALIGFGGPILVPAGRDCWRIPTCLDGRTLFDLCAHPVPADFFGHGSDPFDGRLTFGGDGDFQMEWRRAASMSFCGVPSNDSTPLEITALRLTSCEPATVTYNGGQSPQLWNVEIDLPQERIVNVSAGGLPIPDCGGAQAVSESSVSPPNCGQVYTLRVAVQISHPRVGDLTVRLRHVESNRTVTLMERIGAGASPPNCGACTPAGNTTSNLNVIFADSASATIQSQTTSVNTGQSYRPKEALEVGAFRGGQTCGTWQLIVTDCASGLSGSIGNWTLNFAPPPEPPIGMLHASKISDNGGEFTSSFRIPARYTFVRSDNPAIFRVFEPAVAGVVPAELSPGGSMPWVHAVPLPGLEIGYCDPGDGHVRNFYPAMRDSVDPAPCAIQVPMVHAGAGCLIVAEVSPASCPGACCIGNGELCLITERTVCESQGGVFRGDHTTCDDLDSDGIPDAFEDAAFVSPACCRPALSGCFTRTSPVEWNTDFNPLDPAPDLNCDGCEVYVMGTSACSADDPVLGSPTCPDCNGNGVCDPCDVYAPCATSLDCNGNGIPDECDLNPLDPDGNGLVSQDCNENGVPDECDFDTDGDLVPDDCDNCDLIFNPGQEDMDGDEIGDACDEDADGDGFEGPFGNGLDCDDFDPSINPGVVESTAEGNCSDGIDNDCDSVADGDDPDCVGVATMIRINEIRIDESGSADPNEYFELCGPSGASLAGYTYLVIGDSTNGNSGIIELVVNLDALSIPADGYLLVAKSTMSLVPLAGVDLVFPLNFENGDNVTHMLVRGFSGVLNQDLDLDNDCVLETTPWIEIVDRVALIEEMNPPSGTECHYGTSPVDTIGPDGFGPPSHVYRCPSGTGTWVIGDFDIGLGFDTPGAANTTCP